MRAATRTSLGLALLGLLCVAAVRDSGSHDAAFTDEGLLKANASDLQHTVVAPHWEAPVAGGENVLWCGTFQLAWNEVGSLIGEDPRFVDEPAMVEVLNKRSFTKDDIDAGSYVAIAGFVKDDVHGQIARQLEETFEGRATPHYVPARGLTPRPQDIVAYSYLFKNLEFPIPFERIEKPVVFGAEEVSCFGIGEEYRSEHLEMLQQFVLLDYQDEDDFVIELQTKSEGDRVILAKTRPESTLAATAAAVQKRAANPEPTLPQLGDVLKVPKLNFDLTREYNELVGKKLLAENPRVADDLVVVGALQNIRFQFDEKGVRLRSEAHLAFSCSASPPPPPTKHVMIFDKPFLIMLQRSDADVPYFALWVGDPELLVKAQR